MSETMYKLPDCPEKRRLIVYLTEQIAKCEEGRYIDEGNRVKELCYDMVEKAYTDILRKIQ